jgi:hypothetical protein
LVGVIAFLKWDFILGGNRMKKLSLLFGLMLFVTSIVPAFSANLNRDRQLLQEAVRLTQSHQFRMAYYKLRTIKVDVIDLRPSQAKQKLVGAIDVMIEKLNDHYLPPYQKIQIVKDCARVANQQFSKLGGGGHGPGPGPGQGKFAPLRNTIFQMDTVQQAVNNYNMYRANNLLRKIKRTLNSFPADQFLAKAKQAAQAVSEKINDHYLSAYEKQQVVADCKIVFAKAVRAHIQKQRRFLPLLNTIDQMDMIENAVSNYRYFQAKQQLRQVRQTLNSFGHSQALQKAKQALSVIVEKLSDSSLSDWEKQAVVADCKRVFAQAIQTHISRS